MRISSKTRYGLAAMITMAQNMHPDEQITIISIAEKLGISKIYLEQVFSLLKREGLVVSIKGAQGGYKLSLSPDKITAVQIMRAIEVGLFEKTERSVSDDSIAIDHAMNALVWEPLDSVVLQQLSTVTLRDLTEEVQKQQNGDNLMFYI